jgi:hypothetical protein
MEHGMDRNASVINISTEVEPIVSLTTYDPIKERFVNTPSPPPADEHTYSLHRWISENFADPWVIHPIEDCLQATSISRGNSRLYEYHGRLFHELRYFEFLTTVTVC